MPTIAGMRRRGFTPASLREFIQRVGVTKSDNIVEMGVLEDCIRTDLNENAPRRMAVLRPLKVTITNYPEDKVEQLDSSNHPQKEGMGKRKLPFSNTLYIDQNDFAEIPPSKFKRLIPGGEVRLRNSYVIRCDEIIKDTSGNITELKCSYDENTLGKNPEGRKVKGVIHWVSAAQAIKAQVCLYDRLFSEANPDGNKEGKDYHDFINPDSLIKLEECFVESNLESINPGETFQFEREGYFCLDIHSTRDKPVFNRIVTLRDTWAKITKK